MAREAYRQAVPDGGEVTGERRPVRMNKLDDYSENIIRQKARLNRLEHLLGLGLIDEARPLIAEQFVAAHELQEWEKRQRKAKAR